MAVDRVDPRPAGLDRLGRRPVDGAEPGAVVPVQQRGRRGHQLRADVVEDLSRRGAGRAPRVSRVGILGALQRAAHRPHVPAVLEAAEEHRVLGGLVAERGGAAEHHPAVGDQHLVARVDPQQQRVGPAGDGGVDVGAQRVGAVGTDAGQQRHVAQLERRGPFAHRSGSALRMYSSRSPSSRASTFGIVDAHQLPVAHHTEHDVGQVPRRAADLLGLDLAFGDREPGVRGQQVLHHLDHARRLRRDAEQPARRLGGHHGRVRTGLLAAGAGSRLRGSRR